MVWENANPYLSVFDTFGIQAVRESSRIGTKAAQTYAKIAEPVVKINYRGAVTNAPVDIWNKAEALNVVYKDDVTTPLTVDAKQRDNDVFPNDAKWFSGKVTATVTLSSARGNSKEYPVSFKNTYDPVLYPTVPADTAGAPGAQPYPYSTDPNHVGVPVMLTQVYDDQIMAKYYSMNFGKADVYDMTKYAGSQGWGGGWGQAALVGNNNKEKSVTFYYATPTGPQTDANGAAQSGVTSKVLKNSVAVLWTNIHVR
jgi:hypothetical protein